MELIYFAVLGLVQGTTEFIPVSSSAHLVLVPWLLGWGQPTLLFDTTVHWGTLAGVVVYFRRDILGLFTAWLSTFPFLRPNQRSETQPEGKLAWLIILGTIPAVIMGVLLQSFFEGLFNSPPRVAGLLLLTGVLMTGSELVGDKKRDLGSLSVLDSLMIGIAQGIAIAPGISRSGSTIATALFRGIKREEAARYSFLLGIPIILGAGLFQLRHTALNNLALTWPGLAIGFLFAAIAGFLSISFLLRFLRGHKLYIFAAYCFLIGFASLLLFLKGWR